MSIINATMYEDLEWDSPDRFYPSYIPVLKHEPLKRHFIILESPEPINKGVVSKISFNTGDLVAQCTGFVLKFQTLHSLQHTNGIYYCDEFFAGYLLHSCDPNCRLDMNDFTLHAIKDIRPFDKVTIDYEATEDHLYNTFNCNCGSANCKGLIEGKRTRILKAVKDVSIVAVKEDANFNSFKLKEEVFEEKE